jgi:CRP-like cAMP-binding protein
MATMAATLRQVPYFANLDEARLRVLAASVRERKCDTGTMVLVEGEPCEGLGFVVSGRVKVFKVSAEGKEQVLRLLGPGRTFNDVPVFDGGPNPGSIQTIEPSVIGTVPKAVVASLVESQPKVAAAVIQVLASRLRALTLVIEDLSLRGVVARVAKLLFDCTQGRPALVRLGRHLPSPVHTARDRHDDRIRPRGRPARPEDPGARRRHPDGAGARGRPGRQGARTLERVLTGC